MSSFASRRMTHLFRLLRPLVGCREDTDRGRGVSGCELRLSPARFTGYRFRSTFHQTTNPILESSMRFSKRTLMHLIIGVSAFGGCAENAPHSGTTSSPPPLADPPIWASKDGVLTGNTHCRPGSGEP